MSANYIAGIEKALKEGKLDARKAIELCQRFLQPEKESSPEEFFNTYDQLVNAPPVRFIAGDFWQSNAITLLAALPGHDKTWVAAEMIRAALTGDKLFDYFEVLEPATRVIYLTPENAAGPVYLRLGKALQLGEFIQSGKLLVRTLTISDRTPATKWLTDPRLLRVIENADIFLDTLPRFRKGNENDAEGNQALADALLNLIAEGARSVTALQHSAKGFETQKVMTGENVIRGTGDILAMAATAWGIRKTDEVRNLAYVQNVKPRDFMPPEPFLIRLRPDIDQRHRIGMEKQPGKCGTMWQEIEGPKDKKGFCKKLWENNPKIGRRDLAAELKNQFGSAVDNSLLGAWLSEFKKGTPQPATEPTSDGLFDNDGAPTF